MDIFYLLITNIIPLYILIFLGYVSGRYLEVNLPSMATISIYILAPIVNFGALAKMEFTPEYIALPIIIYIISAMIGTVSYVVFKKIWKNDFANLIAMGGMTGNTMYFGLPIILVLLGPEWVGVYALMNLGMFLNEIGLSYFFGARSQATIKGAIIKVFKLPVIYAIILGVAANLVGLTPPDTFYQYWDYSIGAWIIIGMMLIGVALSKQKSLDIHLGFIGSIFVARFVLWPILCFAVIVGDLLVFNALDQNIYSMFALFAALPLAGNMVAYAATLNLHPEKAAAAVLISTLLALVTIPLAMMAMVALIDSL